MPPLLAAFLKRLATAVIVLIGVSIVIFVIARVIPGDPARIALGPMATQEQVDALRKERHLDRPIAIQYVLYLRDVARGDLGISLYTNRPVSTDIAQFLPATLELVLISGIIMIVIGISLGVASARWKGRPVDHTGRFVSLFALSTPTFVWGVLLSLFLAYMFNIFPIEGRLSQSITAPPTVTGFLLVDSLLVLDFAAFGDTLWHLVLPATALAMSGIGQTARLARANMNRTYETPYIEMAKAFGFPDRRIAHHYALRPAMIPTLTILGLDFAAMLGSAFLVERIFSWPGLSRYGVEVILRKDLDAIVGTVLIIAITFLVVNLLVDVAVGYINPRIRLAERS